MPLNYATLRAALITAIKANTSSLREEDDVDAIASGVATVLVDQNASDLLSETVAAKVGIPSAGTTDEAARVDHRHGQSVVRGVVAANIADLGAFTVAGNDGLTYVEGQRVLLVLQTTAAQNGIYVVGAVATGTAPLTRAADWPASGAIPNGHVVEVSEGTLYAGTSWKAMCTGSAVVGTNDPVFYPRKGSAVVTLGSGTKALGATEGVWLFSTTKSAVSALVDTPDTSAATNFIKCPVAGRTAGKVGTGAITVTANKAADDTTDTSNVSTVLVAWHNW